MSFHVLPRGLVRALAASVLTVGAASVASADICPTSTLSLSGRPSEEIAGPTASGMRYGAVPPDAYYYFSDFGDSVRFLCSPGYGAGTLAVRGRYRFLGAPTGTVLSNEVQMRVLVSLHGAGGDVDCAHTSAGVYLVQDGSVMAQQTWYNQPQGDVQCSGGGTTTFSFTCSHPAGTEFEIAEVVLINVADGFSESGEATGKLTFGALTPGGFMVRCDGDTTVQAVVGVGPDATSRLRIASIWPNPSRGEFLATLSVPAGGPAIVRLVDLTGRVVGARVCDASRGTTRELAFGPRLAPGYYFLQVSQGATTAVRGVAVRR